MGNLKSKLTITNKLASLRKELGITQQDLADAIGVTRGTVTSMEKGSYNPSLELAFRISIYFKKDISQIFTTEKRDE